MEDDLEVCAATRITSDARDESLQHGAICHACIGAERSATGRHRPPPAAIEAPKAGNVAQNTDDAHARWTESLGEASLYVEHARADVDRRHYKSAARNLRKAAAILAERSKNTYGLDRRRLGEDIHALRLTARDVAAGAITSPALLVSISLVHVHSVRN